MLLLDADGKRLWVGAGPSLPPSYNQAIHGALIGPEEGSCGTAAFRKEQIITLDITTDPRWINYREVAAVHCAPAGRLPSSITGARYGTFAMYFREVRSPTPEELQLVDDATAAAALAIQHVRIRDEPREPSASWRQRLKPPPTASSSLIATAPSSGTTGGSWTCGGSPSA